MSLLSSTLKFDYVKFQVVFQRRRRVGLKRVYLIILNILRTEWKLKLHNQTK